MFFVARIILGALFLTSAITKFGAFSTLEHAVQQQGLGFLGPTGMRLVIRMLPPFELLLALSLIIGVWPKGIALITLGLLVVFTVPMAINVAKGNRFPCNCFGQTSSNIGVGTLTRNGVMMVASLLLALMSPWSVPEIWSLSHDLFSLSGTDAIALVASGTSFYLLLLSMSEIDTWLGLLKRAS